MIEELTVSQLSTFFQGGSTELCAGGVTGMLLDVSWLESKKLTLAVWLTSYGRCDAWMSSKFYRLRPIADAATGSFIVIDWWPVPTSSGQSNQSQDSRHRADIDALRQKQNAALEAHPSGRRLYALIIPHWLFQRIRSNWHNFALRYEIPEITIYIYTHIL